MNLRLLEHRLRKQGQSSHQKYTQNQRWGRKNPVAPGSPISTILEGACVSLKNKMEEREKEKMPFTWNWTNELWEISEIRKGGVGVCVGVGGDGRMAVSPMERQVLPGMEV